MKRMFLFTYIFLYFFGSSKVQSLKFLFISVQRFHLLFFFKILPEKVFYWRKICVENFRLIHFYGKLKMYKSRNSFKRLRTDELIYQHFWLDGINDSPTNPRRSLFKVNFFLIRILPVKFRQNLP